MVVEMGHWALAKVSLSVRDEGGQYIRSLQGGWSTEPLCQTTTLIPSFKEESNCLLWGRNQ